MTNEMGQCGSGERSFLVDPLRRVSGLKLVCLNVIGPFCLSSMAVGRRVHLSYCCTLDTFPHYSVVNVALKSQ